MTEKKRRSAKRRGGSPRQSPYFLQPARQGAVTVFRRPAGNRADPKVCGTMSSRALALALVKQLEKAESVVRDLFLEATDDGIEALEAVLGACRESVMTRADTLSAASPGAPKGRPRRGRRRGGPSGSGRTGEAPPAGAEDTSAA